MITDFLLLCDSLPLAMQNIIVSFEPSSEHIDTIEKWLIKESKTSKPGFFVNWQNSVLVSHSRGLMAITLFNDSPLGFITWYKENERVAEIVIAEIQPGYRKKGYGRIMVEALLTKLKKDAIYVVKLHCQPSTSEKAWKKLGFVQFPKIDGFRDYNSPDGKHLYKILRNAADLSTDGTEGEIMQLWAAEPYEAEREQSICTWQLIFEGDSRKLVRPIIFPAKRKWQIRWTKNNSIIKQDGIKYFQREEIDFSEFLIIEQLPLPK